MSFNMVCSHNDKKLHVLCTSPSIKNSVSLAGVALNLERERESERGNERERVSEREEERKRKTIEIIANFPRTHLGDIHRMSSLL